MLYTSYVEHNFGDCISKQVLSSLSPVTEGWDLVPFNNGSQKIMAIGSCAHLLESNTLVWGCGQLEEGLGVRKGLKGIEVHMVRGPRSAKSFSDAGYGDAEVFGDPGVFAPYAFRDCISKEAKYQVGIIPHFHELKMWRKKKLPADVTVVDVTEAPAEVIRKMSECSRLICSSLHGIVVGEAMGIPCSYYRLIDHCDTFKFFDYFEGTGRVASEMPRLDLRYKPKWTINDLLGLASLPAPAFDFRKMMDAAPFPISDQTKDDILAFYASLKDGMGARIVNPTASSTPRFSIVIPCHNGAGYLVRCLSSIARQTYPNEMIEVVAVDDASTDGSGYILERFGEDLAHFKLVRTQAPSGPGGARNRGVEKATGEYLFLVDCDDYLPEKSLEIIDSALRSASDPDVALFPYRVDRPASSKRVKGMVKPPAQNIQQAAFSAVGPWTHVCKRKLYVPMPELIISEDTAWHFAQFDKFETMTNTGGEEPCYVYDRTNATAITDTVEWAGDHSFTLEQLAFGNAAINAGKNDQWISDILRNFANMYDVRRILTKPWVKDAWAQRFRSEISNVMTGHFVH